MWSTFRISSARTVNLLVSMPQRNLSTKSLAGDITRRVWYSDDVNLLLSMSQRNLSTKPLSDDVTRRVWYSEPNAESDDVCGHLNTLEVLAACGMCPAFAVAGIGLALAAAATPLEAHHRFIFMGA